MKFSHVVYNGFDWDEGNLRKVLGRVALEEIHFLFKQPVFWKSDLNHSANEDRLIAMGPGLSHRILFVAFTMRQIDSKNFIRVISARYTHKKEREAYEKAYQALQEK